MKFVIIFLFSLIVIFIVIFIIDAFNSFNDIYEIKNTIVEIKTILNEMKPVNQSYTITAYTAHKSETNNNPQKTAIMKKPFPGRTCAVSRDLMQWLGGKIYIENIGVFKVNDLMNKRFKKQIDICVPTKSYAKNFGKQQNVNVVFLGK